MKSAGITGWLTSFTMAADLTPCVVVLDGLGVWRRREVVDRANHLEGAHIGMITYVLTVPRAMDSSTVLGIHGIDSVLDRNFRSVPERPGTLAFDGALAAPEQFRRLALRPVLQVPRELAELLGPAAHGSTFLGLIRARRR